LGNSSISKRGWAAQVANFVKRANNARAMTTESQTAVSAAGDCVAMPKSQFSGLKFSLRNLFWFITAVSFLLAIVACLPDGGFAAIAFLLAISVIALHLISTAVGSRLRAEADKETLIFRQSAGSSAATAELACLVQANESSRSTLHSRGRPLGRLPLLVALGAAAGGVFGATLLEFAIGDRTTLVGVAVGALSTAIVGGWFAFLGVSFWTILRQGWRDAVAE
jgi:hypothetical protein